MMNRVDTMRVGVSKDTYSVETPPALIPSHGLMLTKIGLHVLVESGAGQADEFRSSQ